MHSLRLLTASPLYTRYIATEDVPPVERNVNKIRFIVSGTKMRIIPKKRERRKKIEKRIKTESKEGCMGKMYR